jgi:hypothetical protein
MTKSTNTPANKTPTPAMAFDIGAAVKVAQSFKDTETKVGKAKTALDNATARRNVVLVMFADTCRAAGFKTMAPLQAKGQHRVEFLGTLAPAYLTVKEAKAYASDMATSDRSSGKQVLTAKGQAKNKLTAFVTRLLKASEPFLNESQAERDVKAKEAAKTGANATKAKTLDVYTIETLQAILKRIGTDARKTDPSVTCHEAITDVIKAAMKNAKLAFANRAAEIKQEDQADAEFDRKHALIETNYQAAMAKAKGQELAKLKAMSDEQIETIFS